MRYAKSHFPIQIFAELQLSEQNDGLQFNGKRLCFCLNLLVTKRPFFI